MARALELDEPPSLRLCDAPPAVLAPRGIRVKALLSGVSHGTELSLYRGTSAFADRVFDRGLRAFVMPDTPSATYPATLGYELVGQVEEAGEDVHETFGDAPAAYAWLDGHGAEVVKVVLDYDAGGESA